MHRIILPITIIFMFLTFGCENKKEKDSKKDEAKKEILYDAEFWKEGEWDVKKIVLISLKNNLDINKTKNVLNLYYENYEKWNSLEWGEDGESEEYEKWVYEEINKISLTTAATTIEVAKIIWEWETEECIDY